MILDPAALARTGDRCWRPTCGHDRRWHTPCTARIPTDEGATTLDGLCLCPRFLESPDEYEHELAAIAEAERVLADQRARQELAAARAAEAEELTIGPGDVGPVPAQDDQGGPIAPEVANG